MLIGSGPSQLQVPINDGDDQDGENFMACTNGLKDKVSVNRKFGKAATYARSTTN